MKKRLVILAGSLIAAALSVVIFAHKPMSAEQALLLRNVEALAQSEGGNGGGSTCTVIGNHSVAVSIIVMSVPKVIMSPCI